MKAATLILGLAAICVSADPVIAPPRLMPRQSNLPADPSDVALSNFIRGQLNALQVPVNAVAQRIDAWMLGDPIDPVVDAFTSLKTVFSNDAADLVSNNVGLLRRQDQIIVRNETLKHTCT